jgi:hypothetical protein
MVKMRYSLAIDYGMTISQQLSTGVPKLPNLRMSGDFSTLGTSVSDWDYAACSGCGLLGNRCSVVALTPPGLRESPQWIISPVRHRIAKWSSAIVLLRWSSCGASEILISSQRLDPTVDQLNFRVARNSGAMKAGHEVEPLGRGSATVVCSRKELISAGRKCTKKR